MMAMGKSKENIAMSFLMLWIRFVAVMSWISIHALAAQLDTSKYGYPHKLVVPGAKGIDSKLLESLSIDLMAQNQLLTRQIGVYADHKAKIIAANNLNNVVVIDGDPFIVFTREIIDELPKDFKLDTQLGSLVQCEFADRRQELRSRINALKHEMDRLRTTNELIESELLTKTSALFGNPRDNKHNTISVTVEEQTIKRLLSEEVLQSKLEKSLPEADLISSTTFIEFILNWTFN